MQIPNVATLNGLVVTLGQKQQEEFVPVGSHLIDDRGKSCGTTRRPVRRSKCSLCECASPASCGSLGRLDLK